MIREYFDRHQARRVRSRTRKRGYVKLVFGIVLLIGVAAAGRTAWSWAAGEGWFDLTRVTVSGNRLVPGNEVLAVARCWLRRPVWRIDRRRLSAALQRRNPAIGRVDYALWPWWTLALTVRERRAVARVESDPALVIDAEGVVFRDSARTDLPGLRIAGTSGEGRMRALTAITLCPRPQPDWLFDPGDGRDVRLLAPAFTAHLGSGNFTAAWRKLEGIRADLDRSGTAADEIDVRYRDQGIVVLKAAAADPAAPHSFRN
ncbi:MAG TPA: hypothetical protein VMF29_09015 [Candidatus Edwardsbacteria bacterium]|nr:hypothetical protein [Candidatus Edwardsbacteria bacterium]